MNHDPVDLDKHRGMAAQKATDIRRVVAEVEANAKTLRDWQGAVESQLLVLPATTWAEAAAKGRYVLNLYAAQLAPSDTHHRDLVAAVLTDFIRRRSRAPRPHRRARSASTGLQRRLHDPGITAGPAVAAVGEEARAVAVALLDASGRHGN